MADLPLDYFRRTEPQIFQFWDDLTAEQKLALENQLQQLDLHTLEKQKKLIQDPPIPPSQSFDSFTEFAFSGNSQNVLKGQELIKQGRLGCLLLAGGQGTRLQHEGPKGTYPISVIKHKSLYQLCAEKVKAASAWAGFPLRLAIMTSLDNDQETRSFFQQHQFFGLHTSQVFFFIQESLPFLDANERLFLKNPWEISRGPDGNGNSLLRFAQANILQEWLQEGIEWMNVILIDNPLADPFDAELIGFHHTEKADVTLKCTEKMKPDEKVGIVVKQEGRCKVVEYSEMAESEKIAKGQEGRLKHCCANLSLFCFSLSFIQRIIQEKLSIPLHKAWKAAQYVDETGHSHLSSHPIAWKFETFIFDWLVHTHRVKALLYPREQCFAPLKNFKGADTPETVREALQNRDKAIVQALTGLPPPHFPFELSAEFYYPSTTLLNKWNGRHIESSYVIP